MEGQLMWLTTSDSKGGGPLVQSPPPCDTAHKYETGLLHLVTICFWFLVWLCVCPLGRIDADAVYRIHPY